MKITPLKFLMLLILSFFLIFSCKEDDVVKPDLQSKELTEKEKENKVINQWIIDAMGTYYLWKDSLPSSLGAGTGDPELFFNSLLVEEDRWSYIVDDFEEYNAEFEGTPTSMGYSPQFWLYNDSKYVMIVVQYVYPGSPAENAGLKRGDIILQIDEVELNPDNYYELYSGDSYSVQLASLSGSSLMMTGESISLNAEEIDANPIVHDSIYDLQGIKTGYLVYTGFVAGNQEYYLDKLSETFQRFKDKGITELVVDLRYNRGGDMRAALHLGSMLAPVDVAENEEIMVRYVYNEYLTRAYSGDPENSIARFKKGLVNLDLDDVYFMVTSSTASASEVVIAGLQPYMTSPPILIGTNTAGKYTGMFVLDDFNDGIIHNWGLMPVTFKYSNADGYTNFGNGISPDHRIEDDLLNAVPFGDPVDPMLAKAFELISGQVTTASLKSKAVHPAFERLEDERFSLLNNLVVKGRSLR